ncbi:hypothetical protein SteCoe_19569 [Stentor coeruleus]|uniref:Calcium-dependent protein kinase 1 n=1 Tax=Stentor coeruleus TaxID=5963 RepID=A0A1R2BTS6_9CILI|nr:hypothetical protein SteCoe_19569 [Stentor coeruleus]
MGCSPTKSTLELDNSSIIVRKTHIISNLKSLKIEAGIFVGKKRGQITKYYEIENKLGEGTFGFVREAKSKLTGMKRAIKSINKKTITADMKEKAKFFAEVDVLIKTDHPNILKLYEFYEDENYYHLVTEFVTGGELLDFVVKHRMLTEPIASHFMKQLLSGIFYCHQNNIVHRDLKPENLLLDRDSPDALLKIIDFGTSQIFSPRSRMTEKYGTILYIAPEVLKGYYDEKCDIWSCGVILYILLSGRPPFTGRTDEEIIDRIIRGTVSFDRPEWDSVSISAKSLVKKMLHKDPFLRISARDALRHDWITMNCQINLDQNFRDYPNNSFARETNHKVQLENLMNFRAECKLQQAVLTFIATQFVTNEESNRLIDTFKQIDRNGDGKLSREELVEAFRSEIGYKSAVQEVEKIMMMADTNKSGFIDYTEFVVASAQSDMLLCDYNLNEAFKAFDTDNSGKISAKELKEILGIRIRTKDELWKKLIMEVDENGDGELDITEFKAMMMKLVGSKLSIANPQDCDKRII